MYPQHSQNAYHYITSILVNLHVLACACTLGAYHMLTKDLLLLLQLKAHVLFKPFHSLMLVHKNVPWHAWYQLMCVYLYLRFKQSPINALFTCVWSLKMAIPIILHLEHICLLNSYYSKLPFAIFIDTLECVLSFIWLVHRVLVILLNKI